MGPVPPVSVAFFAVFDVLICFSYFIYGNRFAECLSEYMRHHATCRVVSLSHSESFTQIAKQSWATYKLAEGLYGNSGNRKSEVADMIDEASDWISVDVSVALVETTLQCHRRKAVDLVRLAVNNLKVKSKTVNSTPEWVVLEVAGKEEFYSDRGER